MGFFDDATYADMDWLSQATTPLVFSGTDIIEKMPDKVEVTNAQIKKAISSSY